MQENFSLNSQHIPYTVLLVINSTRTTHTSPMTISRKQPLDEKTRETKPTTNNKEISHITSLKYSAKSTVYISYHFISLLAQPAVPGHSPQQPLNPSTSQPLNKILHKKNLTAPRMRFLFPDDLMKHHAPTAQHDSFAPSTQLSRRLYGHENGLKWQRPMHGNSYRRLAGGWAKHSVEQVTSAAPPLISVQSVIIQHWYSTWAGMCLSWGRKRDAACSFSQGLIGNAGGRRRPRCYTPSAEMQGTYICTTTVPYYCTLLYYYCTTVPYYCTLLPSTTVPY